jgi:ABC-2 type transport system permease protein
MNIFKFELKRYSASIISWSLGIVGIMALFLVFFPTFSENSSLMDQILSNYPEELLKAFGMTNEIPLSTVNGYVALLFPYVQICFAIQSALYGFGMLSLEERNLTADFLLSKPVSRDKIFINKLISVLISILLTILIFAVSFYGMLIIFSDGNEYQFSDFKLLLSSLIFFQLFVFTISVLISQFIHKVKSTISLAMGIGLGFYILSAFEALFGSKIFQFITPFYYFNPTYMIKNQEYHTLYLWISIAVTMVSLISAYFIYQNKDIQAV